MSDDSVQGSVPPGGAEPSSATVSDGSNHTSALTQTIFNLILLVLAGFLFYQGGKLPASAWEPLGPGSFPRIVLGLMILLSGAVIVSNARPALAELKRRREGAPGKALLGWWTRHRLVAIVLALFAFYVLLLKLLGFVVTTIAFLILVQWWVGPKTRKNLFLAIAVALIFSIGTYYLFQAVLNVFLPAGALFE